MWAVVLAALAAGCGRFGFDVTSGDGPTASDGPIGGGAWSKLVAYANQTCAVRGGAAYCWGENAGGQLGLGGTGNAASPKPMLLPSGAIAGIAQGESHGCAIVDGKIYCTGSIVGSPTPVPITTEGTFTAIAAGKDFTCAIGGGVWCWGINGAGQLGLGDTAVRDAPTQLALGPGYTVITVGDDHACAAGVGVPAVCWGHNDNGTLGNGMTQAQQDSSPDPTAVANGVTALPRIAGWHACALQGSDVLCWGRNVEGELGNGGATGDLAAPMQIVGGVTVLATGGGPTDFDATCVVAAHAECWGFGAFGRLGQGAATNSDVPTDVHGLPDAPIELAIGYDHACAVVPGGDLWCWGRGDLGQLGDGLMTSSLVPVRVVGP